MIGPCLQRSIGDGLGVGWTGLAGTRQQGSDVGPELLPGGSFGFGEGIARVAAERSQVGVLLPVGEGLSDGGPLFVVGRFEKLGPGGELGLKPGQGLGAKPDFRFVVQGWFVLTLAGGGQHRGTGGIVGVLSLSRFGERRVVIQGLAPEAGGGGGALRVVGVLGQGEPLGVAPRGVPSQYVGQAGVEGLETRIAGLQLSQTLPGLDKQVGVAQPLGGALQVRVVVAKEPEISRIAGVRVQGFLLPANRLAKAVTCLSKSPFTNIDHCVVVQHSAEGALVLGDGGVLRDQTFIDRQCGLVRLPGPCEGARAAKHVAEVVMAFGQVVLKLGGGGVLLDQTLLDRQ